MTQPIRPGSVLTGRTTNWPAVVVGVALLVPLLAMSLPDRSGYLRPAFLIPAGLATLAVVVSLGMVSSLRTTAGPQGLTVHFGVLGWPRFRYRIGDIRSVQVVRVSTAQLVYVWTPSSGLTLALRGGEAVRLHLANGRRVTVGVDDAHAVAATLVAGGCEAA